MSGPYARLAPTPGGGITIPGVGVPGGDQLEEDATQAAVDYGNIIAIVIIGALIMAAVRFVTQRINFPLLLVLILIGAAAYYIGKGGS